MKSGTRVLVIGGGAREHALLAKLSESPSKPELFVYPRSAGMRAFAEMAPMSSTSNDEIARAVDALGIELVVFGPEAPLVAGAADAVREKGALAFGPGKAAAQLEGSKAFSKRFMEKHGIPTAGFRVFSDAEDARAYVRAEARPLVVKADGLAGGKGVVVAQTTAEALGAIDSIMVDRAFQGAGAEVVIEDCLVGEEVSFHVVTDGKSYVPLATAQDHKRLLDGDRGPNTGGMGAYSPAAVVTPELEAIIDERVVKPSIEGLSKDGLDFRGVLFIGLMIVRGLPYVLEYNVRFGDPECEVLMARYDGDVLPLLVDTAQGELVSRKPVWSSGAAIAVVLASGDYPHTTPRPTPLSIGDTLGSARVLHGPTRLMDDGTVRSDGGRVLTVVASGEDVDDAADKVYAAINAVHFEGMQFRKDIGWRARRRS